jgi:hypothetical protein
MLKLSVMSSGRSIFLSIALPPSVVEGIAGSNAHPSVPHLQVRHTDGEPRARRLMQRSHIDGTAMSRCNYASNEQSKAEITCILMPPLSAHKLVENAVPVRRQLIAAILDRQ